MADDGTPESQDAKRWAPPPDDSTDAAAESQAADDRRGPDALNEALERLAEAREYAAYLAAAEFDRLKMRLRRMAMWAIIGVAAVVVFLAILVTAVGMLLWGLATLLAALVGWPMWAGAMTVGGGVVLIAVAALLLDFWAWNRGAYSAARRRFEARKQNQRERFGRSVDRAEDRSIDQREDEQLDSADDHPAE